MKSRSEEFEEWGTEVIFGRAKGFRAAMMRMILRGASWLFRLVVLARLYLFHSSIARQARLGMLVVSVGNITVEEPEKPRWWNCWPAPLPGAGAK